MNLSRLSKKCQACPDVLTCTHKEMEALAYMEDAMASARVNAAQPLMVSHDYRNIKISDSMNIAIDVEELKRELEKSIYKSAGLMFGA